MKSYKRTLIYLFLAVVVFGTIINVIYQVDDELYSTLRVYQKWGLVIVALLIIVNEIRNWNKPETNFENDATTNSINFGRKKLISMAGLAISLTGFVLFVILDSPLPGSIITSSGLLILYYALYLFVKK